MEFYTEGWSERLRCLEKLLQKRIVTRRFRSLGRSAQSMSRTNHHQSARRMSEIGSTSEAQEKRRRRASGRYARERERSAGRPARGMGSPPVGGSMGYHCCGITLLRTRHAGRDVQATGPPQRQGSASIRGRGGNLLSEIQSLVGCSPELIVSLYSLTPS